MKNSGLNVKNTIKHRPTLISVFCSAPHIIWALLFIIIPLIFIAVYAFTDYDMNFSIANFKDFFSEKYLSILVRSIKLSFYATFICLIIGFPAAYFIYRTKPSMQKILILFVMFPMWMNFLIRTYAWQVILQDKGIINSFLGFLGFAPLKLMYNEGAVVLGMVYDFLPYMILPIYSVLCKLDFKLVEAALDLGCNHVGVLSRLIIPLSMPGVISGITMVFVPSISTFYISQKLGGGKFYLIGDAIETQYNANNNHMAAAISFVLMVIILIGMIILRKFSGDDAEEGIMP